MKTKTSKVTKLLAVVAIATSPAVADPTPRAPIANRVVVAMAPPAARPDPWAGTAIVRVATAPNAPSVPSTPARPLSLTAIVELVIAQPRVMPSGAPACGNVASRAPRAADCGTRTKP
jgi:hypothetical protein